MVDPEPEVGTSHLAQPLRGEQRGIAGHEIRRETLVALHAQAPEDLAEPAEVEVNRGRAGADRRRHAPRGHAVRAVREVQAAGGTKDGGPQVAAAADGAGRLRGTPG